MSGSYQTQARHGLDVQGNQARGFVGVNSLLERSDGGVGSTLGAGTLRDLWTADEDPSRASWKLLKKHPVGCG